MAKVAAEVGSTANRYQILAKLAVGGMAEIFLARGASVAGVERYCVLKRILRERSTDAQFVQMFLDEAQLAAQLQHPNIASVYDIGMLGDSYFFTMEYVHGETVRSLLERAQALHRSVPLACALTVVAGAAAGLHHAHERRSNDGRPLGIVHRDVTPSNVMVSFEGNVKLVDFGVAKAANRAVQTQSGTVKGKISYLSPEQCRGERVDRRSDLFSLGIVMWETLTGERLYRRASDFDSMNAIVNEPPPPPSARRREIPRAVDDIVLRLLAKDVAARFQTAAAVVDAIEDASMRAGTILSTSALSRLIHDMFGVRAEPWLALERQTLPHERVTLMSRPIPGDLGLTSSDVREDDLASLPDLSGSQLDGKTQELSLSELAMMQPRAEPPAAQATTLRSFPRPPSHDELPGLPPPSSSRGAGRASPATPPRAAGPVRPSGPALRAGPPVRPSGPTQIAEPTVHPSGPTELVERLARPAVRSSPPALPSTVPGSLRAGSAPSEVPLPGVPPVRSSVPRLGSSPAAAPPARAPSHPGAAIRAGSAPIEDAPHAPPPRSSAAFEQVDPPQGGGINTTLLGIGPTPAAGTAALLSRPSWAHTLVDPPVEDSIATTNELIAERAATGSDLTPLPGLPPRVTPLPGLPHSPMRAHHGPLPGPAFPVRVDMTPLPAQVPLHSDRLPRTPPPGAPRIATADPFSPIVNLAPPPPRPPAAAPWQLASRRAIAIALAIIVGVVAARLWTRHQAAPASGEPVAPAAVSPGAGDAIDAHGAERAPARESAPPSPPPSPAPAPVEPSLAPAAPAPDARGVTAAGG